jgi:hypothetical protein
MKVPKTPVTLLITFIIFAVLITAPPRQDEAGFLAANIDKLDLLKRTEGRRIILVGGSNLAYSVDGKLMERELQIPTVNMGLHGGLGMRFSLEEVKPLLHAGDVIVVVPEYEQFYGQLNGSVELLELLLVRPQAISSMSPANLFALIGGVHTLVQRKTVYYVRTLIKYVYAVQDGSPADWRTFQKLLPDYGITTRRAFDDGGNMVAHLGRPALGWGQHGVLEEHPPPYEEEAVNCLKRFQQDCGPLNARLFVSMPAIPEVFYAPTKHFTDRVYNDLLKAGIKVLGPPQRYLYPSDCFFDSAYHMLGPCREKRTMQLVEDLKASGVR